MIWRRSSALWWSASLLAWARLGNGCVSGNGRSADSIHLHPSTEFNSKGKCASWELLPFLFVVLSEICPSKRIQEKKTHPSRCHRTRNPFFWTSILEQAITYFMESLDSRSSRSKPYAISSWSCAIQFWLESVGTSHYGSLKSTILFIIRHRYLYDWNWCSAFIANKPILCPVQATSILSKQAALQWWRLLMRRTDGNKYGNWE